MKKIFQFLESRVLKIELFLQGRKQQRGWSEKGGNRYGSLKCECSSENVEIWCAIFFAISLNYSSEPSWFGAVKKKEKRTWQIFVFSRKWPRKWRIFCARKKKMLSSSILCLIKKWVLLHMWIYFADTKANLSRHQIEAQIDVPFPFLYKPKCDTFITL